MARRWTGYFHDWQFMKPARARAYGKYLMASCEPHNWQAAQLLGLRTFTVTETPEQVQGSGIECLADSKGIQCSEFGLCDRTSRRDDGFRKSFVLRPLDCWPPGIVHNVQEIKTASKQLSTFVVEVPFPSRKRTTSCPMAFPGKTGYAPH